MKLAVFIFISSALHVAVISYPWVYSSARNRSLIPVTILSGGIEPVGGGEGTAKGNKKSLRKATLRPRHTDAEKSTFDPIAEHPIHVESAAENPASDNLPIISLAKSQISGADVLSVSAEGMGGQGNGVDRSGTHQVGAGSGNRSAAGRRTAGVETAFTPIGLRYSPKPEYPERARRGGGKEGRVMLRVVVGVEGQPKTIEVTVSSGNDALDQAARDTLKSWRFSPARYEGKPVERWVDVPIDFHLTEARN